MTRYLIAAAVIAGLAAAAVLVERRPGPSVAAADAASTPAPVMAANPGAVPPPQAVASGAAEFLAGRQYIKVPKPTPPADSRTITVNEFFWYACPHCFRLEPLLADWRKTLPPDVQFVRTPCNLGLRNAQVHERAFYAAQQLGIEDQVHPLLADALVQLGLPLDDVQSLDDFFVQKAHLQPGAFTAAFQGSATDADVAQANQLALDYGIAGVPEIVVGGEYRTDIGQPGIYDARLGEADLYRRMLDVTTRLVSLVRSERTGGGA